MRELRGKVAVVTGAASGIGHAMVGRFLAEGMRVVMADVEAETLLAAAEGYGGKDAGVLPVPTDVADAAQVESLAERTVEAFGAVHLLCSNAGVSTFGNSWEFEPNDWRWVLDVNLWGVVHGIRSFVPRFIEQGEGHVVNTSSMAGVSPFPGLGPYTASKAAVVALSEGLALELEAANAPVGVSVLCPGFVRTRIASSERNRPEALGGRGGGLTDRTSLRLLDGGTPPEQVADLVAEAVKAGQFWIFSHPEMLPAVESRMKSMLQQENPSMFSLKQLG